MVIWLLAESSDGSQKKRGGGGARSEILNEGSSVGAGDALANVFR